KIGTTGRGIGPVYEDKAARRGIKISDLTDPDTFKERLRRVFGERSKYLSGVLGGPALDVEEIYKEYKEYGRKLKDFTCD
ncbi:MAG: adenylosuccinate synthase, partial [Deltaproteobacteria bacterium]|nr:adenylosuccinate synthase [Deltaproteobacteria bacterium]